jgi:transposase
MLPMVATARKPLLIETILERKPHPEQGFRACLGIVRLLKPYGRARLEAACGRALPPLARAAGGRDRRLDRRAPHRGSGLLGAEAGAS